MKLILNYFTQHMKNQLFYRTISNIILLNQRQALCLMERSNLQPNVIQMNHLWFIWITFCCKFDLDSKICQNQQKQGITSSAHYTALIMQRICEANPVGANFYSLCQICFTYHIKIAYVVLHMAVKEFFETNF